MKNASHISTFCSFVDLYRPEYAILENVVNMASTRTGFEDQNVLSQLVACLVSMGYQVNQYIMDAWSYGSAQQRSRVFLTIAAPGLEPIIQPWHTHSLLKKDTAARNLGKLPNGQRFGAREHYPTPFAHVSAREVTSDLPNIGNASVQICIPQPDHRVSQPPVPRERALLQCIPKQPPACGYREAYHLGLIPHSLQRPGKEVGKAFRRVKEVGLFPTITTNLSNQDSRNGATIHWLQDRPITILDARRAQGYLDEEPIIGSLIEQYKIIGNGVDRKVSFALGLALLQAVEHNRTALEKEMLVDNNKKTGKTNTIKRPKPPPSRMEVAKSKIAASRDAMEISRLDGSSDAREPEPEPNIPRTTLPALAPTSLLSCISATVTKEIGGLALRSQSLPPTPTTVPVYSKRSIEEEVDQTRHNAGVIGQQFCPNKRAKVDNISNTSTVTNDNGTLRVEQRLAEGNSKGKPNMRHTRHSGLEIEFTPKQWNKQPEKEHIK
jgi:DNA (cytosine-5)-methyltransferase 1